MKRGEGNKDFKKGSKLGQGVGALKRGWGWGWNPLTNYEYVRSFCEKKAVRVKPETESFLDNEIEITKN